ncbi:NERD domain-containing protein [Lysinibacillus sp. NPDC094177]|uniref:NERD domain-containing protein n=1 Tax=Lysinibacillus sp. NPDC094177 TaxID=3390580 RepID=UPI003CFE85EC
MLAEIYNKISQTGSNLSDRLEDKLTGDFFGTIRYLPFELGLKHVFSTAQFNQKQVSEKWLEFIENEKGHATQIEFWHREEEGEIDVLLINDKAVIGIEVKYLSGLSSEDQVDGIELDYTESIHQLARYSRMIEKYSKDRESYLLFLAPYEMMNTVRKNILNRSIISPSIELGFMCWQDIHDSLLNLDVDQIETGQQLILSDLQALLSKKGLTCFKGFNSNIFNQPIVRSAYSFKHEDSISNNTWIWPTKTIKEDQVYEYNTTD